MGSVPGSERSPGEGNGKIQYSCLGNPTDRGAWWVEVHRAGHILVTKQQLFAGKEREEGEKAIRTIERSMLISLYFLSVGLELIKPSQRGFSE